MRLCQVGTDTPVSPSNRTSPASVIRPRVGRIRPATSSATLVLPEPDRPNRRVILASLANATLSANPHGQYGPT